MSAHQPKKLTGLQVQVSFDACHMASECLADAYEQLIPISRQTIPTSSRPNPVAKPRSCAKDRTCRVDSSEEDDRYDYVTQSKEIL